jgi:hypothetical protein
MLIFSDFENFIKKHPTGFTGRKWNMEGLSANPSITSITLDFIEKHPNWKWDVYNLSKNPSITPKLIKKHPDWNWEMLSLSINPMTGPPEMMFKPAK